MTIINFPSQDPGGASTNHELVPSPRAASSVGAARGWLERQSTLPSPARAKSSAGWWCTEGLARLGVLALKAPYLVLLELRPIFRGFGRIVASWARWCAAVEQKEMSREGDGNAKTKAGSEIEARKSGRRKLSFLTFLLLVGGGTWTYFNYPLYLVLAGIVLVIACDAVGRAGTEKTTSSPPPMRTVLKEGVPLSQVESSILNTLAMEGFIVGGPDSRVGTAQPLRYYPNQQEYRMQLSCLDEIEPKHLRAIERGTGAADYSVRCLATDIATVRELVIRDGDPLALDKIQPPGWIPTGSVSVEAGPLDLGVSMTEVPFALDFAGVHIRCVAGTGGGKTAWFLRNTIDRLSACRDVVLWGIDLTNGPELPLWRGVIQRRAFNPKDAESLLDAALAEIDRRAKILAGFAEDDDPANDDITEWCSQLGPWLVIAIDEFSTLAEYNGKPAGALDLLGKAKQIIRTGRKHGVSLTMFAQRTGVEDFGSSVMSTQAGTAIVGPCDMSDTLNVWDKERRDGGYAPHLLTPGTKDSPNDAGKCFIDSPRHRTPDIYRAYLPLSAGEVKRRARQRLADGLPRLDGAADDYEDVAEVPPILVAVEKAFADAGSPEWIATVDLLPAVQAQGFPGLTENALSSGIPVDKNEPGSRKRRPGEKNVRQGYLLTSIQKAMEQL